MSNRTPKNKDLKKLDPVWFNVSQDYTIKDTIGQGSYGEVVHAIHTKSGKHVAIKLIRQLFTDQYSTRKIISEI